MRGRKRQRKKDALRVFRRAGRGNFLQVKRWKAQEEAWDAVTRYVIRDAIERLRAARLACRLRFDREAP